jgi:hypothetical protein
MLALLLERTLQHKLKGKYTADAALEVLEGCHLNQIAAGADGTTAYTLTEPTPEQAAISIPFTTCIPSALKVESRSKMRCLGAVSNGNAPRSCWLTHVAVGCSVTPKCMIGRCPC